MACYLCLFTDISVLRALLSSLAEKLQIKVTLRRASQEMEGAAIVWKEVCATVPNFSRIVQSRDGCDVLHFSGHGVPARDGKPPALTFEDDNGLCHLMPGSNLKELFLAAEFSKRVKCVFVSACHSEDIGKAFEEANVPHVVAVAAKSRVHDEASIKFADMFYNSLINGSSVKTAFDSAKYSVEKDPMVGSIEARKFVLMGKGDPAKSKPFASLARGSFRTESKHTHTDCNDVASPFVGRGITVSRIYEAIRTGERFVSIIGERGIGKTEVALKVAKFAEYRLNLGHIFQVTLTGMENNTDDIVRAFSVALGVRELPTEMAGVLVKFRERFSTHSDHRYLCVLDGVDRLRGNPTVWGSFQTFFSRLLRCTGAIRFIVASVQSIALVDSTTREKVFRLQRLDALTTTDLLLQCSRNLRRAEIGIDGYASYRGILSSLSRTAAVEALAGHPGATRRLAVLLDKDPEKYRLDNPAIATTTVPALLRELLSDPGAESDKEGEFMGRPKVVPTPDSVRVVRGALATLPQPARSECFEFWVEASLREAESVAPKVSLRLKRPGRGDAAVARSGAAPPPAPPAAVAEGVGARGGAGGGTGTVATSPEYGESPTPASTESGSGGAAGPGTTDPDGTDPRHSMPPGVPGGAILYRRSSDLDEQDPRAGMPPGVPGGQVLYKSEVWAPSPPSAGGVSMARPQSSGSERARGRTAPGTSSGGTPNPGHGHAVDPSSASNSGTVLPVDIRVPLPWARVSETMNVWFKRIAPEAAAARLLSEADFSFFKGSSRLSMVDEEGMVYLIAFAQKMPLFLAWMHMMLRIQYDWAQPGRIAGWLNGEQAGKMLVSEGPTEGKFLIRFSESSPGKLVICCLRRGPAGYSISQTQVEVLEHGRMRIPAVLSDGTQTTYTLDSLDELILRLTTCVVLYPNTPKRLAFAMRHPAS